MGFLLTIIIILGSISLFGIIMYFAFRKRGYNYQVTIWKNGANGMMPIDDIGKIIKDRKDGTRHLRTWKTKLKWIAPPDEYVYNLSENRRKVEIELYENGNPVYISRKTSKKLDNQLSTTDRQIMCNEYYKALEKKGRSTLEMFMYITPLIILTILLICVFVFYESLAKPTLDMADKVLACQETQTEQLRIIKEIKEDVQIIGGDKIKARNETINTLKG